MRDGLRMLVVSWNVNSLKVRAEYVSMFLDAVQPDVIGLQELKLDTDAVPVDIFESRGYHVAICAQKQWNGVLLASKHPLEDIVLGLPPADQGQARLVCATTGGIRFVNLYCPQGQSVESEKFPYKLGFYDALLRWIPEQTDLGGDVVVMGDLNIAPEARDIYDPAKFMGVPSFHPDEHLRWQQLCDLGFQDTMVPHLEAGTYSFWDYRGGAFRFNKGMRIDHIMATSSVNSRVEAAWVERDWRKVKPVKRSDGSVDKLKPSDHAPVAVRIV